MPTACEPSPSGAERHHRSDRDQRGERRGQHAFVAAATDGTATRTGAYLLNPDGTMSLMLMSGAATDLGMIPAAGTASAPPSNGVGLNNKGQVAVPMKIGKGAGTLALLIPVSP